MSQVAGSLEIQIFAGIARLQKDMDQAKRTVSSAADAMSKILGTIGVGVSLAGITNLIRSTADAADKMRDLKIASGLAIEQIGGLGKAAAMNGSNIDQVARAVGIMSQKMYAGADAFKVLGVEVKNSDGTLRDSGQVLLDISDKFARMSDGATKSAVANEIFGKSGRDLIPTLNQGRGELEGLISAYAQHSGMTQKLADDSDKFNDILYLLGERVTGVKNSFVGELLPTLNAIGTAMLNAGQTTGQFSFAASVVVPVLKGLAIAGFTVVDTFRGMGREIGARAAQLEALSRLDFKGMAFIGKSLAEDNAKSRAEYDKLIDTIMNGDKVIQQANVSQQKMIDLQVQIPDATDKAAKAIERKTKAYDIEIYKLKQYEDLYKKGRDLTASVATDQERYNQKLEELNQLKPYVTIETYNRALEKAQKELKGTEVQTRETTDEVSQLWMQAGRNIQSALANSIFNFFDDGLKGMLKNVISTVGRIASEFAALRIAQGVGLAGMFGSGTASAGSTGSALNLASMGSSAMNLFKFGGGISQGVSGLLGIGSTGTQAAAEAGAMSLWGSSGASASIGSSIASFAGPAIAVAAVDQIVRMLAGDKMIGGTAGKILNYVPVVGPLINGLFGRGPMKQQGTLLDLQLGAEGIQAGMLQTRFKAKGGLFRSDKIDYSRVDAVTGATFTDNGKLAGFTADLAEAGKQIFDSVNEATKQTTTALRGVASNLGLTTAGIDNFSYSLKILTEKGEMIQGEQIAEEIAKISEGLATSLMPGVKEFQRSGETAVNTLVRLSTEFSVLTSAAGLLFDKSSEWSKDFVNQFSIGARSAFLEKAGGADAFAGMVSGFAQNFLTDDQRMKPVIAALIGERDKLGLSVINTRQQYTGAVQSGNLNQDQLLFLLKNQDAINQVFIYLDKFNSAVEETAAVTAKAARELNIRNADETEYGQRLNKGINETAQAIAELEGIAAQLAGTVNSINPLSVDQARAIVSSGNPYDPNLNAALSTLSNMGTGGFSSRADFARSQGQNVTAVNSLQSSISTMTMSKQAELAQYEFEKLSLQQALNGAASAYNSAAGFDTGTSYVPKTGLAVIHEGERIINDDQNKDIVSMLSEIATQVKKTADTLVRVTRNGDAMVTA